MKKQRTRFLESPAEIRKALHKLTQRATTLKVAVAFVGTDWQDAIANYSRHMRVICWLTSTNTNPHAVRQMMSRKNLHVRQRDRMHAKVYVVPRTGAIIGSANLSQGALSDADEAGQNEAAVILERKDEVDQIAAWFDKMWQDQSTRKITKNDLVRAIQAWKKAPRHPHTQKKIKHHPINPTIKLPSSLIKQAKQFRNIKLESQMSLEQKAIANLNPHRIGKQQLDQLVDSLVEWFKHPGIYNKLKKRPLKQVRKGLSILFDESTDVIKRLARLQKGRYLNPLRIPSLSMLLYCRVPRVYPPFNNRTKTFLKKYRLLRKGLSASSAVCYSSWLKYANQLSQALNLPTPGHIDPMIYETT